MQITVEIKTVYGNKSVYPACETSKLFASIAGAKTLTSNVIRDIRALGYTVEVKQAELPV